MYTFVPGFMLVALAVELGETARSFLLEVDVDKNSVTSLFVVDILNRKEGL